MCCVGGMVGETIREATGHEFEPRPKHIYLHIFLLSDGAFSTGCCVLRPVLNRLAFSTGQLVSAVRTGTERALRPVLKPHFVVVVPLHLKNREVIVLYRRKRSSRHQRPC